MFDTALALPVLDHIPARISLAPESPTWASLALWCDNAGLVIEADWRSAHDARDIALSALNRWAGAHQWRVLNADFHLVEAQPDTPSSFGNHYEDILSERGMDVSRRHLGVVIAPQGKAQTLYILPTLLALEEELPGLPETALYWLRYAAFRTVDVLDPARVYGMVSHLYWMGEDDERDYLEMVEEGEAEEQDIPRKRDFEALAPAWVWQPGRGLGQKRLKAIAADPCLTDRARQIAAICLGLARDARRYTGTEQWHGAETMDGMYGLAAFLTLTDSDHDLMDRVWDDYLEYAYSGDGGTEEYGLDLFPFDEAGFRGWLKSKKRWFRLAGHLDALLQLIGEVDADAAHQ